jgi:apolipoprotein N-acyltransferase
MGASEQDGGKTYNSAYCFRPDGTLAGIYHKMDLVLFGEYVPYRDRFPFLRRFPIRNFDYTPGTERKVFPADGYRLAPLICFEGIFPDPSREVTRLGADLIVIITSDAWALHTFELQQHSLAALFRAIESRRYLVRAATNGISAIYDPYGETLDEVGFYTPGVATATIAVKPRPLSTYHRFGDVPLIVLCLLLLALGLSEGSLGGQPNGERGD